jgi:hypothetical protein
MNKWISTFVPLLQNLIPEDKLDILIEVLEKRDKSGNPLVHSITKIHSGGNFLVFCRCSDDKINRVLGLLDELGISGFGGVDVVPIEI